MDKFLIYAPRQRKPDEAAGDEFVVLRMKDPNKAFTKAQVDGLIARRESLDFEGSVNFCFISATDDKEAVRQALAQKFGYVEPGEMMMRDDPELDAFMAEHGIGAPAMPRPRP